MERLTRNINGKWVATYGTQKITDRLAAYEDSNLSPEEVMEMKSLCEKTYDDLRYRLRKYEQAVAEGRLVELPCKVGDLQEKYRELTKPEPDEAETYTTGYQNGIRNGQAELIAYLLQIDTGTKEAAEKALEVKQRGGKRDE